MNQIEERNSEKNHERDSRGHGRASTFLIGRFLPIAGLIVVGLIARNVQAGDSPPQWLRDASSRAAASYPKSASAAVLLRERNIKVDDGGKVTTTERRAIKLLTSEGKSHAS